jgi:2-polyprenyl-6-methoxyphenol hydroxylase-like FAD-dependent oxidoreductase
MEVCTALLASEALRVAVVGGSMGGLAAATAFLRLGAHVRVFEKSPLPFSDRGSSLGFCAVDLWQQLTGRRMIRRGQQASRAQGAFLYGDLWAYLKEGVPDEVITYGTEVTDLGDNVNRPTIAGEQFDLAIIADGSWSMLRSRYFGPELPRYAGWQAWRFKVPLDLVPNWNAEGEYQSEFYHTILMRIAKNDGSDWIMGGTSVACPESDVLKPEKGANRHAGGMELKTGTQDDWFLPFFEEKYSRHAGGEVCRAMAAAAKHGKITPNPQYEFCASRIVKGRLVLVGDAAHTAVPRTAAGAHTAILDGMGLLDAFRHILAAPDAGDGGRDDVVKRGLESYEPPALDRARSLYNRSLQVSLPVLPPGWSSDAARTPMTMERAKTLGIPQLKAELLARRVSLVGLSATADLLQALLMATGLHIA